MTTATIIQTRPHAGHPTALHAHIQAQQCNATKLVGVLLAIETLDSEGVAANAVTSLIGVAVSMAHDLNTGLDSVNLPD